MIRTLALNGAEEVHLQTSHNIGIGVNDGGGVISELDDIDLLVRKYRARILRFATFSTGDPDLAETITQDCFLKAYNKRAGFRGDCSVNTWLTGIALNLIRDHHRTEKFKFWKQANAAAVNIDDVAYCVPSGQTSAEATLIAKETVVQVWAALEKLPFRQRTIFLMRFSDEMDIRDIAELMGMSVNTVKTHLHRAVTAVRKQLGAKHGR